MFLIIIVHAVYNLNTAKLSEKYINRFTKRLHDKGYRVKDFLEYWDVSRRTYERYMADTNKHDKLKKMIEAM